MAEFEFSDFSSLRDATDSLLKKIDSLIELYSAELLEAQTKEAQLANIPKLQEQIESLYQAINEALSTGRIGNPNRS